MTNTPYTVELAQFYNGEFFSWQECGPFPDKHKAWDFIKSRGLTAKDKNDKWMAYPAGDES